MQPYCVEKMIGQKGSASNVACIFKKGDAEEKNHDQRHKRKNPSNTMDNGIDKEIHYSVRQWQILDESRKICKKPLEPGHRIFSNSESQLEYCPDDKKKERQADIRMHYDIIDLFGKRDSLLSGSAYCFSNRSMYVTIALFRYQDFGILAIMKRYPAPSVLQGSKNLGFSDMTGNTLLGIGIFFDEFYCYPSRRIGCGEGAIFLEKSDQIGNMDLYVFAVAGHTWLSMCFIS